MHRCSLINQAQAALNHFQSGAGGTRDEPPKNVCVGGYNHFDEDCVPLILRI